METLPEHMIRFEKSFVSSLTDQYQECRIACGQICTRPKHVSESANKVENIFRNLGAKKVSFEFRSEDSRR